MAKVKVRYRGFSDVREISKDDLDALGVKVEDDLVFSRSNLWAMTIEMSEELEEILRAEGTFSITALDQDGNPVESVATPTKDDDTVDAAEVVDVDTGQTSKKK